MKAIRVHAFGGPEVLSLDDVPEPEAGPSEIAIRVCAIGVNPVDTYVRAGIYGPRTFPFTLGGECAGVVLALGEGVSGFAVGDRVYAARTVSGAYAERATCDARMVRKLPDKVSLDKGAALGTAAATAYMALFLRGDARPGQTVLIHGASGGVGIAAVQLARASGLEVIGTAGSADGAKLVAAEGAHHVLDHSTGDVPERVARITHGKGVDLIVEMLANKNLSADLGMLAKRGRVVVVGSRGRVEIDPRDTMTRQADVRGMSLFNATDEDWQVIHAALAAFLESGALRPIVGKTLPLADAATAHREIIEGKAHGKIILVP
ncbi:MAG: NADPH:quinone reductase [Polyangiaceae bacterium]